MTDSHQNGFGHDQTAVAEKICCPRQRKELRRPASASMTVPIYSEVRKWFCMMCDEDMKEKSAARVMVLAGGAAEAAGNL